MSEKPTITVGQIEKALIDTLNQLYGTHTFQEVDVLGALSALKIQSEIKISRALVKRLEEHGL